MALNLTGIDIDLYFTVGSSVNGLLLFGIVLPTLTLIVICVIAILLAKELCGQMKALLVNIFAGEACTWLSAIAYYMMFIIVVQADSLDDNVILCGASLSLYFVATLQISSGTSLYAIMHGVFIYQVWRGQAKMVGYNCLHCCVLGSSTGCKQFALYSNVWVVH